MWGSDNYLFGMAFIVIASVVAEQQKSFLRNTQHVRNLQLLAKRDPLPPYPFGRYQDWSLLDAAVQAEVDQILEYKEDTWNLPGQNPIERLSFETINLTSLGLNVEVSRTTDGAVTAIDVLMNTLNITEEDYESWDCYVNHYRDYSWEELVDYGVDIYFAELGWDQPLWDAWEEEGDPAPDTQGMDWYLLTEDQKTAAQAVCFFPELWAADVMISQWKYQPLEAQYPVDPNATTAPVAARVDVFPYSLPQIRLTPWASLTADQQNQAAILGYNESSWNTPGIADVESMAVKYEDLTPEENAAAWSLGIDAFYWDCLIQHYENKAWYELADAGVLPFWETLGWTYESWHGIEEPPVSDGETWDGITLEQQAAAIQLCYLPETFERGSDILGISLASLTPPPATP